MSFTRTRQKVDELASGNKVIVVKLGAPISESIKNVLEISCRHSGIQCYKTHFPIQLSLSENNNRT